MKSITSKIAIVNPHYTYNIDWKTLPTTIAENLHALSLFKHETFDDLQYNNNNNNNNNKLYLYSTVS